MNWLNFILSYFLSPAPPPEGPNSLSIGNSIVGGFTDRDHNHQLSPAEIEEEALRHRGNLILFTDVPQGMTDRQIAAVYSSLPSHIREGLFRNSNEALQQVFLQRFRRFLPPETLRCRAHTAFERTLTNETAALHSPPPASIPAGRHNASSPIFSSRFAVFQRYRTFAMENPAFLRFGSALYFNSTDARNECNGSGACRQIYRMIPLALRDRADQIARRLYEDYCRRHGLNPETAVDWSNGNFREGVTYTYEQRAGEPSATAHVYVERRGIVGRAGEGEYYFPAYLIALHELGHAERTGPHAREHSPTPIDSSIEEIAQTVNDIINQDFIYKTLNGIPMETELTYPGDLPTSRSNERLNLGRIANFFRRLRDRYGSVEEALMSPEGRAFVTRCYSNLFTDDLRARVRENSQTEHSPPHFEMRATPISEGVSRTHSGRLGSN